MAIAAVGGQLGRESDQRDVLILAERSLDHVVLTDIVAFISAKQQLRRRSLAGDGAAANAR